MEETLCYIVNYGEAEFKILRHNNNIILVSTKINGKPLYDLNLYVSPWATDKSVSGVVRHLIRSLSVLDGCIWGIHKFVGKRIEGGGRVWTCPTGGISVTPTWDGTDKVRVVRYDDTGWSSHLKTMDTNLCFMIYEYEKRRNIAEIVDQLRKIYHGRISVSDLAGDGDPLDWGVQ